jgi:choline-sulfatase
MLNTGRTLWRAEAVDKTCEAERQAGRFWSEHLKRAGYRTYFTGKWHIQAKVQDAFDVVQDVRPGMPATVEASYNRPLEGMPDLWNSADPTLGGYWENGKHLSEITADVAISFLKQAQAQPDPFFMYVAFNAPHDPRQASQEFLDRYPVDAQPVPPNFMPEYPEKDSIGCDPKLRDEKLLPFPRTPYAVQVHRREYFAMITHLDEQIGRIMAALEASGKARNTWVVFTADHGLAVGQHGLVGKQNMYDHSLRVPFIVVGPEVQSGQRISAPIYLQSVLPTTLELAGCEVPEHVDTPVCSRGCGGLLHQLTCRSAGPT